MSSQATRGSVSRRPGSPEAAGPAAPPAGPTGTTTPTGVHRFAAFLACAIIVLITAGGLVTSTDSGLAVPDWPLSYGQLFPPMVGGILYEHGHRMIATAVGFLTIILAWVLHRWEPRRWVRRLGLVALGAVIAQGLLGGLTVLLLLPTPISVAHACLAQAFLLTVVTIATVTRPSWNQLSAIGNRDDRARATARRVLVPALATTGAIYGQLILGALTRHTGAGLAIPDFPLALGRIVPPLGDPLVAIQFAHRVGALAVTALVVSTARRALGGRAAAGPLRGPSIALLALTALQVALGATAVWTRLAVLPATLHVTTGATLLATSLILTLRAQRLAPPTSETEPVLAPLRPVMP